MDFSGGQYSIWVQVVLLGEGQSLKVANMRLLDDDQRDVFLVDMETHSVSLGPFLA